MAEKLVTLGKRGTQHDRRLAVARLHQEDAAKVLFNEIAPAFKERRGGYTRIVRLISARATRRNAPSSEWVDFAAPAPDPPKTEPAEETKTGGNQNGGRQVKDRRFQLETF